MGEKSFLERQFQNINFKENKMFSCFLNNILRDVFLYFNNIHIYIVKLIDFMFIIIDILFIIIIFIKV